MDDTVKEVSKIIRTMYRAFFSIEDKKAAPLRAAAYEKKLSEEDKRKKKRNEKLRSTGLALIELAAIRANEQELRETTCKTFGFNESTYKALSDNQKAKATAAVLLGRKTAVEDVVNITGLSLTTVRRIDYLRLSRGFTAVKQEAIFSRR